MNKLRHAEQISVSGLLFIVAGVAVCFAGVPSLYAESTSAPGSFFIVIVLMFAWCMIPLSKEAPRSWWMGFLCCVGLFYAVAHLLNDFLFEQVVMGGRRGLNSLFPVLAFIITMPVLSVVVGSLGGYAASAMYRRRVTHSSANV